jgi:hypothetical protein
LTYTFQDQNAGAVLNTNTHQPLKLPQPYATQEAGFVFGNTADIFPQSKFPGADGGQIIGAIMQALNRGVALDGLNPAAIHISTATSSFLTLPSGPVGVATITTTSPHGIPQGVLPATYKMNITGVNVQGYNGTQPITPFVLTGVDLTTFTFQYLIATDANKSVMDGPPVSNYDSGTQTTNVTVTVADGWPVPIVNEVVYFKWNQPVQFYTGQHIVTGVGPNRTFTINLPGNHLWLGSATGGIIWSGLYADGMGGTVTPVGASSIAWNNYNNWYGAPSNPGHTPQRYNTYSKFLHYSTINGTDSRLTSPRGTPIFINNQAYGFALDETPDGPYAGQPVSAKFDQTIPDGSTINLTLSPWRFTPTNP